MIGFLDGPELRLVMNYSVRFYSLGEKFQTIRQETFSSIESAQQAAIEHGSSAGFTNIKFVDDDDYTIRVTATTPNGRHGRNIAAIEPDGDFR
jgi:hypothetical protein